MQNWEIIAGLEDLIRDRESFVESETKEDVFWQDILVLRAAIQVIRRAENNE